jgi:uncharacterized alkaline shock family protein YloU
MTAAEQSDHHVLVEVSEDGMRGTITVAPNVLADIIELASAGTEGLIRFVAPGRGRARSLPIHEGDEAESRSGEWYARNGIRVRLENATIDADLSIEVQHGANVPVLAEELKRRISDAVDRMLGLKTGAIAVHVRSIAPGASDSGGRR